LTIPGAAIEAHYRFVVWLVPKEIIGKLNAAAVEALADQGLHSRLAELGYEVYPCERQTPEALFFNAGLWTTAQCMFCVGPVYIV
jgi:hypothetical protein